MFSEKIKGRYVSCINDESPYIAFKNKIKTCDHCANDSVSQNHDLELMGNSKRYTCDINKSDQLLHQDIKCNWFKYSGLLFNVKYQFYDDYPEFQFSEIPIERPNIMIAQLPNNTYWELLLKPSIKRELSDGTYRMTFQMGTHDITKHNREYYQLSADTLYSISSYRKNLLPVFLSINEPYSIDTEFSIVIDLYRNINDFGFAYKRKVKFILKLLFVDV